VTQTISDNPHPSEYQRIAQATKDRPESQQIHTMLLRSMQQAIYTPVNNGHFGLAFDAYTHFTSPIRRYPDLLVHRVIKAILTGSKYQLPTLPLPGEAHAKLSKRLADKKPSGADGEARAKPTAAVMAWQAAGLHCSANERRADEASRDVEAWLKCKYMQQHLGEEFAGSVTSATSFGLFVTLDAMFVEGLVHITELGGEYFRFDDARQELRGERTGIRYQLGTRVQVQVSRVDLDGRRIDFRLVTGDGEAGATGGSREDARGKDGASKRGAARKSKPADGGAGSSDDAGAARKSSTAASAKGVGARSGGKAAKPSGKSSARGAAKKPRR
jgi:ribonuclease R